MKLSRFYGVPATLALALLVASSARATESWLPKVGYSADVTMKMSKDRDGNSMIMTGKVYGTPEGDERREMAAHGRKTVIITRQDENVTWILSPEQKVYWESRDDKKKDPEQMIREGNAKITDLGWETINGIRARKQRIEVVDEDGGRFVGHRWVTSENVPVRMEGTANGSNVRFDYTNIKTGRQDPGLFRVPADYQLVAYPGGHGPGPMGVAPGSQIPKDPPPGMTKEQWEQMKKQIEQMQQEYGAGK